MRKSNAATASAHVATECYQMLSIDMGFIVQQSKNTKRFSDFVGINGETCYILITDQFSGMQFGRPLVSKTAPIEWLNNWLARYTPNIPNKSVRMDQGHELGRSKRVTKLFQQYGYHVEVTGADASHQNGIVERSHQTIGNMIRILLIGSNVPKKLWPYALYHCFFIMNRVLHDGKNSSTHFYLFRHSVLFKRYPYVRLSSICQVTWYSLCEIRYTSSHGSLPWVC